MDDKGKGIIAYIFGWIGGLIVLLAFKDNNKKTTIHACQSIVASVAVMVINFIYGLLPFYIPFFSTVIWALQIVVLVMGIVKVVNNEDPELPVIGGLAKSIFASKIDAAPDVVNNTTAEANTTAKEETKAQEEPAKEENKEENKNN